MKTNPMPLCIRKRILSTTIKEVTYFRHETLPVVSILQNLKSSVFIWNGGGNIPFVSVVFTVRANR